jgi:hypothetical protein
MDDAVVGRQWLAGRRLRRLGGDVLNAEARPFEHEVLGIGEQGIVVAEDQQDVAGKVCDDIPGIRKAELCREPKRVPALVLRPRKRARSIWHPADLGHGRIWRLAARPDEHVGRNPLPLVGTAGERLGSQQLIDGQAARSHQDLAGGFHQPDVLLDVIIARVLCWHLLAALVDEFARLRPQALEGKLRAPMAEVETVVCRHVCTG